MAGIHTEEVNRLSARSGRENARFFFAKGVRGAVAEEPTLPRLDQLETRRRTKVCGRQYGMLNEIHRQ
jgi:hypothetical protein